MEKFVIINRKNKSLSLTGNTFNSVDNKLSYFDLYNDFINSPLKLNYSPNKRNLLYNINKIFYDEMHSNEKKSMFHGTLAYGEVQSGKTMNMIASMFKAYDLGFRNFVVLTGSTTDLHDQTVTRFKTEKDDLDRFVKNETEFVQYSTQEIEEEIYSRLALTSQIEFWDLSKLSTKGDFIEFKNSTVLNQMNVIFCLKEDDNLTKLENLFKNYSNLTKNRNGTTIIDDEIDWGFKIASEEKRIYDTIKNIQTAILEDGKYLKYVGFTATPYKILQNYQQTLIQNEIVLLKNKKISPEFLPEIDDLFFLKNNPFYVGLDFFHTNNFKFEDWKENEILKEIFTKKYISIINENELSDIFVEFFIEKSLYLYLMNSFLFAKSSQEKNLKCKSTFALFFVDLKKYKHDYVYETLQKAIQKIAEKAKINQSIFDLIDSYQSDLSQLLSLKRNTILTNYSQKAFDSFVVDWTNYNLQNDYNLIIKMYGDNLANLEKEKKKDYNNNFIVIGGVKISRGVTFPNLLLEIIIPASINKTSTLQRARWFGFRNLENLLNLDLLMTKETKRSFEEAAVYDLKTKKVIEKNSKVEIN